LETNKFLCSSADGQVFLETESNCEKNHLWFLWEGKRRHCFRSVQSDRFLCIERNGKPVANRAKIKNFEQFTVKGKGRIFDEEIQIQSYHGFLGVGTDGMVNGRLDRGTGTWIIHKSSLFTRKCSDRESFVLDERDPKKRFGVEDGRPITNKSTILHDLDELFNGGKPPDLELIYTEPWARSKALGISLSTNPYGHISVRYTVPSTGKSTVMNIVGFGEAEMVNFVEPEDFLFGTNDWKGGNEQGAVYNRNFISIRIENVPEVQREIMDCYYHKIRADSLHGKIDYKMIIGPLRNKLSGSNKSGNCSHWTGEGLAEAGIISNTSMWPKKLWISMFEKYSKIEKQHKLSNMHVVRYKRIAGCISYGTDADPLSLVQPGRIYNHVKYSNLRDLADVEVYVPQASETAKIKILTKRALKKETEIAESKVRNYYCSLNWVQIPSIVSFEGHNLEEIEEKGKQREEETQDIEQERNFRLVFQTTDSQSNQSDEDTRKNNFNAHKIAIGKNYKEDLWVIDSHDHILRYIPSLQSFQCVYFSYFTPYEELLSSEEEIMEQTNHKEPAKKKEQFFKDMSVSSTDHSLMVISTFGNAFILFSPNMDSSSASYSENEIHSFGKFLVHEDGICCIPLELPYSVQQIVCIDANNLWAITDFNAVINYSFGKVEEEDIKLKQISVCEGKIWGIDCENNVQRKNSDGSWTTIQTSMIFKQIHVCNSILSNDGDVWALGEDSQLYVWNEDDTFENLQNQIPVSHFSVNYEGQCWGICELKDKNSVDIYHISKQRLQITSPDLSIKLWSSDEIKCLLRKQPQFIEFWRSVSTEGDGWCTLGDLVEIAPNGMLPKEAPITKPFMIRELTDPPNSSLTFPFSSFFSLTAEPLDYTLIWSQPSVSIWEMVPPENYVSVGCIVTQGDKPELYLARCLHESIAFSLTEPNKEEIWSWKDITLWRLTKDSETIPYFFIASQKEQCLSNTPLYTFCPSSTIR